MVLTVLNFDFAVTSRSCPFWNLRKVILDFSLSLSELVLLLLHALLGVAGMLAVCLDLLSLSKVYDFLLHDCHDTFANEVGLEHLKEVLEAVRHFSSLLLGHDVAFVKQPHFGDLLRLVDHVVLFEQVNYLACKIDVLGEAKG